MSEQPTTIYAITHGDCARELEVVDSIPYDPSAGQWDEGWFCVDVIDEREFFVSKSGIVYVEDEAVGEAAAIKAEADRIEAEIAEAHGDD